MEVATATNQFNVSTEIAFIQRFLELRGIAPTDFLSIHDRALSYMNSLKNGYSDCSVKFQPEFDEFWNQWNGGFYLTSEHVTNSINHLLEVKTELEVALSSIPAELLDADISVLMGDKERRDLNSTVWAETREHYNSVYQRYAVPITSRKWFTDKLEKANTRLALLEGINGKTQSELEDVYLYSMDDIEKVFALFTEESVAGASFDTSVFNVYAKLVGGKEIRAYLSFVLSVLFAWIEGLPFEHWYKVVDQSYRWKKEKL